MSNISSANRDRLLPTYRWDKATKLSQSEAELRNQTTQLLLDFRRRAQEGSRDSMPPASVIEPIVAMNVGKRTAAIKRAEQLIAESTALRELKEKGYNIGENVELVAPPPSLIPTFMNAGREIPGLEDAYMKADHPSQELFAYSRLGKSAWLNRRFGEHCLTAIGYAHPNGIVKAAEGPTRVKAHDPAKFSTASGDAFSDWVVVSSKAPVATIEENGRRAALISRVTGAVDLSSPELSQEEKRAIQELSAHEQLPEDKPSVVMGQKALLLAALERSEGTADSAFYPVIQTMYLTQIAQV